MKKLVLISLFLTFGLLFSLQQVTAMEAEVTSQDEIAQETALEDIENYDILDPDSPEMQEAEEETYMSSDQPEEIEGDLPQEEQQH
jgi:hypothetical protein